ncbi:MAG: sulfotransferase [Gammaproteobacteria bacterium]
MWQNPDEGLERLPPFSKDVDDEAFLHALNKALASVPLPPLAYQADPWALPIIYIVGAPRSGTTLLSQLLSRCLEVGYINNVIARFWMRPRIGIRLSRILLGPDGREKIALQSVHGTTKELAGPHEFGYFWRHWLRLDESPTHRLSPQALARIDGDGLREILEREILAGFGTPVVLKNVICGLQAAFLSGIHRSSLFVHIRREPYAAAASVLECRRERYGNYSAWWSLKPSTYPEISALANPAVQVAAQILDSVGELEQELARPGVNSLTLPYEQLCADPGKALVQVRRACEEMGYAVAQCGEPPRNLVVAPRHHLPAKLDQDLRIALARHDDATIARSDMKANHESH